MKAGTAAVFAALLTLTWLGQALAQGDSWFQTASGQVPITRHPSQIVCAASEDADLFAIAARVEIALRDRYPEALVAYEHGRSDFDVYGVALLEIDGVDFGGMALALELVGADPQVTYAEPVYLLQAVVPLYPHNLLAVKFADHVSADRAADLHDELGGRVVRTAPHDSRLVWVEPQAHAGSVALANRYDARAEVAWAEPDFLKRRVALYTPDDPQLDDQWHLSGGAEAVEVADVEAAAAFDLAYSVFPLVPSDETVIGVCDTGVLVDHEDLRVIGDGMDLTYSEVGINPDDNGDGHGTSVAGVAAAHGDNGLGVAGACPTCGVVGIKLNLPGVVSDYALFDAYYWAATTYQMPALNNSWGLDTPWIYVPMSNQMKEAVDAFSELSRSGKGGVIVFASGNSNQLAALDGSTGYVRTLTVGASTCDGQLASYSNYGHAVDVIAPSNGDGCGITTTSMNSTSSYTGNFGGTSSAAPLVSGIVGLMAEANPDITEAQIREAVIMSADAIDAEVADYGPSPIIDDPDVVFSWTHAHGRVNAEQAVALALAYGDSGCTQYYELCNQIDDNCDGFTDDEYDACNPCTLDSETNGREFCDDGIDNDCDGLTDPPDCIEPCEDLKGLCSSCDSGAECWPGLDCSPISLDFENTFCLKRCYDASSCPEGFWCELNWTYTCIPDGFSCDGLEEELPDPSCEEDPEEDAGPDGGDDGGTTPDSGPDASAPSSPDSGCGCNTTGRVISHRVLSSLLSLF